MAVSLKHAFTSAIADDAVAVAAGEVVPSNWNEEHNLTGTNNSVLFIGSGGAVTEHANLTFNPTGSLLTLGTDVVVSRYAAQKLMISGDGTGTAADKTGFVFGSTGAGGTNSGLWHSALGGSSTAYSFRLGNTGNIVLNMPSTNESLTIDVANAGTNKMVQAGTAGAGPTFNAGTATADVNALNVTQTWNAAGVTFTHEKHVITDTASAAGSLALQYLGGASGTTNLLSLDKAGVLATGSSIELGHASDTTLSRSAAGVMAVEGVVIPSISSTNTLTNKRKTPRRTTTTGNAPTWNSDNCDILVVTAITNSIDIGTNMTLGTHTEGDPLAVILLDDGTGRAITWGSNFEASTVALPTTTVASTKLRVGFLYNSATSKFTCTGTA